MINTKLEDQMVAYIESASDVDKGNYKNYLIKARTPNGLLSLKYWNMRNKSSFPEKGDFVNLKITNLEKAVAELEKYKGLSLDSTNNKPYFCELETIEEKNISEETLKIIKKDRSKQRIKALEMLKDDSYWKNKELHSLLMNFFKKEMTRFTEVPAAVQNHHCYKGGLFIHTGDVVSICQGIVNSSEEEWIDSDVLYIAAWFHDAGKIEVYSIEDDSPKINSDLEKRIGHATISNQIFTEMAKQHSLETEFINNVSHCILSHHDRKEWGALVEPASIEAMVLCRADLISSKKPD